MEVFKISIYDLMYFILNRTPHDKITTELKRMLINDLSDLLNNGWTDTDIVNVLSKVTVFNISDTVSLHDLNLFKNVNKKEENILKPFRIYYHSELKIVPRPVKIDFDYNTGEIIRSHEEYFLEMKSSYTIDNLIKYYISKTNLSNDILLIPSKIKGALNWLLKNYDLEVILYMIDIANDHITSLNLNPLNNVMDLQEYYTKAIETLMIKSTESKANGDDKIVPRKRQLCNCSA